LPAARLNHDTPETARRTPRMNHGVFDHHLSETLTARNYWQSITHLWLFSEPSPISQFLLKCRPQSRMPQQQRIQTIAVTGHLTLVSVCKHTFYLTKTKNSIAISALYLKQQWDDINILQW